VTKAFLWGPNDGDDIRRKQENELRMAKFLQENWLVLSKNVTPWIKSPKGLD
jgi:hypothetical protein